MKLLLSLACLLASAAVSLAQGNYSPVVTADLVGAGFNHYYGPNLKAVIPPDFSWSFTKTNLVIKAGQGPIPTNLVIKAGQGPIPTDLLEQLAGGRKDVKTIEAGWKVEAGELIITGIKLDGQPTRTVAKLSVGRTAPTVIRIGKHQYVFVPRPPTPG